MIDATPDCRCGHSFHGHLRCWNLDCDCPEQRDTPTLAEAWDEGYEAGMDDGYDVPRDANPYRPAAAEGNET